MPTSHTNESNPTPGNAPRTTPKSTESTPLKIISHSFSISRLSQMAMTTLRRPVRIAQKEITYKSTSADMPGQKSTASPKSTAAIPLKSSTHQLPASVGSMGCGCVELTFVLSFLALRPSCVDQSTFIAGRFSSPIKVFPLGDSRRVEGAHRVQPAEQGAKKR